MLRVACGVLLVALLAQGTSGATITVRKDGTGDFSVLYLAVSAAADGDTILIGPGEYKDTVSVLLPDWGTYVLTHGDVLVQSLTIIGAGEGVTVIGPSTYSWDGTYGPHGLSMTRMDHQLYISDLTIRNCYSGLYFKGALTVERCELRNNDSGIRATLAGTSNQIRDCHFSSQDPATPLGILTWTTSSSLQVEDCQFAGTKAYVTNSEVTFRNCQFSGGTMGIDVINGAHCEVWDCDIANVHWGLSTYLGYPPSQCHIHNSRIAGTYAALLIDQHTSATVEGSVLAGGSNSIVYASDPDAIAIHGCDFVKGTGPVIRSSRPASWGAVTYDLTNNYWGTTDEATIQSWIIDRHDDSSIYATVLYSPFAGQSVPSETTTWGDLKALWR